MIAQTGSQKSSGVVCRSHLGRWKTALDDQTFSVKQADDGMRVSYVNGEKHSR